MARKSGKTRSPIQQEYYKQRSRISKAIKRMEKQGYIFPEFSMPSVPKKITKSSISRLQKITPKSLREKYGLALDTTTGEVKEAQVEFNRRRLQSAKQSPKTRARKQAEEFNERYFPTEASIVLNNFVDQAESIVDGREYLENIIDRLTYPEDMDSYQYRKKEARIKSNNAADRVVDIIQKIIRNKSANKVAHNIMHNGKNPQVQSAIDRMLYSYEVEEIVQARSELISLLTDNGALSSYDYYVLSDDG